MYDWRGFSSLSRFDSGSRRRCGNVESRVLCGFPSSEGGRNRCRRKAPSSRPRSVISTARPRFIGHSVENAPFGRPAERKWRLSESRVECTILQILAQSRFINDRFNPRRSGLLLLLTLRTWILWGSSLGLVPTNALAFRNGVVPG
jgi:hypothetical protein